MPIARPAPKSPVKASVAAAPAKPPVGSLMDRPMGPGGNLPMRPMPSTPAVQTSRPGPQIGSPVPVTPQPIRPGLGQGSVGQLQQAQLGQATPMGGGLQGIGPRASELSMDQLLKMQREMGQQADLQQQNALSKIPAYAQMQALQGQLQGRQPTPQELQQLRMYDQQIQSDPGFRQMQGNLQQMGQQFEQQYGGQLQKMQQAQYAGLMGSGPVGYNPAMLQGMQGLGSSPTGFGGMGMAGGPAPYSPGMQIPLSPYNTTTQQNIMGSAPMGGGMGMPLGGLGANAGAPMSADTMKYLQGIQGAIGPYNTTTQQNIMGSPQAQPGVATPMGGGLGGLGNLAQARGPMNQMASTLQGFQQQAPVQPPMSQGTGVTQQPGSPPQQNRPTGGGIM